MFERLLKLVKRRNRGKKEPILVGLEDFHKLYQFLFSQYENLKRQSDKKISDWKEPKIILVMPLARTRKNELLALDHFAALSKIQEIEIINKDLGKEADEKEKRLCDSETVHEGRRLSLMLRQLKLQGETIKALYGQVSVVRDEATKFMKQVEDNDNNLTSKLEESMVQITGLKAEMDYLRAQSSEIYVMKQELDSLHSQKTELKLLLETKSKEASQYLIQVKTLKEELARKSGIEQVMAEEKGLQMQVMELESEVDVLRKQKHKLEDDERSNICKINQLREETSHLNGRILELEALFRQRDLEISAIQEDYESKRINKTAQTMTLSAEVELLQQKVEFMMMEKSELELRIADQKRIMKERQENTNNSMESTSKLARRLSTGTTFNINVLERKMEDLAEEFQILYQRIMVAEKALEEKLATCEVETRKLRDSMEANKKAFTESNLRLKKENETLGKKFASYEAEFKKLKDPKEPMKNALNESNSRLEQENALLRIELTNCEGELKKLRNSMEAGKVARARKWSS
ncbi:bicaudal D-related protein 2-like [Gossypium australe]|uniref:Bicaudal D-related protein 2-like n=1 Tax=Gossypium australe TaxID=47621 RepID=A0A5B6UMD6_9ROSI|nr:bicaudal D-related protein 2-like [Gossypium australe]